MYIANVLFRYIALMIILLVVIPLAVFAQTSGQELKLRETITAKMNGKATSNYQISIPKRSFMFVLVDQKGIDVIVRLFNPSGTKVFEIDSANGLEGPEPVFWKSEESSGNYRLDVCSEDESAALGTYEITVKELRASYEEDEKLFKFQEIFKSAEQLWIDYSASGKPTLDLAFAKYGEALLLYEDLSTSEKYRGSEIGNHFSSVNFTYILRQMGQISLLTKKCESAVNFYEKCLAIYKKDTQENDYSGAKAIVLASLGEAYNGLNDKAKAKKYYLESVSFYISAKDKKGELIAYNNLGSIFDSLGEKRNSVEYYSKALGLVDLVGDKQTKATIYSNLGLALGDLDDFQKALDAYNNALVLNKENHNYQSTGVVLSNMGTLYDVLGDSQRALEAYDEAIKCFEMAKSLVGKAKTLVNKGVIYEKSGKLPEATKYYNEAFEIFENKNELQGKSSVLTKLASIELSTKNYEKAISLLVNSLEIRKSIKDFYGEAYTNHLLGNVFLSRKDFKKAIEYYVESIRINREIGDKRGETANLYFWAKSEIGLGHTEKGKELIENAINILEDSRLAVRVQKLRNTYLQRSQSFYELYVDILMQLYEERGGDYNEQAFNANERSRSRGLLEVLANSNENIYNSVDPQLLLEERTQQSVLDNKLNELVMFKRQNKSENDLLVLEAEIKNARMKLEQTESKIKSTITKDVADRTQPLEFKTIQKELLDSDSVLLQYCLGNEKSYLWVASKSSLAVYVLPKKEIIEDVVEQVYKNITFRSRKAEFKFNIEKEKQEKITKADRKYQESIVKLSEIILKPALKSTNAKQRLIVVPDGKLRHIPFGLLIVDSSESVIDNFDVVTLSSASSLYLLRKNATKKQTNQKLIAIIAEPVFDITDERLRGSLISKKETAAIRGIQESDRAGIDRIPFSGVEAEAISTIVPNGNYKKLTGIEASVPNVLAIISYYKMLHFATHGVRNKLSPELSGILLSLIDQNGVKTNGILSNNKVASLKINADLVVLSSCESGLGEEFEGEGTVGIAKSFIYAGARRVVTSLWAVDDEATAEFMKYFYENIFMRKKSASSALRLAQLQMKKNPKWSSPFFWGAFSIEGEYN